MLERSHVKFLRVLIAAAARHIRHHRGRHRFISQLFERGKIHRQLWKRAVDSSKVNLILKIAEIAHGLPVLRKRSFNCSMLPAATNVASKWSAPFLHRENSPKSYTLSPVCIPPGVASPQAIAGVLCASPKRPSGPSRIIPPCPPSRL